MTAQPPEPKLAPNSPESEQAVLCSILTDSNLLFEVSSFLRPTDFFTVRYRYVYEAILKLSEAHSDIDNLTVIEMLRSMDEGPDKKRLDVVGGSAFITELANSTCDFHHIETYARLIEAASIRRKLLKAAGEIAQASVDEDKPVQDIITKSESILFQVTEHHNTDQVESAGQIASRYYDQVESLYQKKTKVLGIPTGFAGLDEKLSGLQKGSLVVIGAPPGVGKTAFALHLAMNGAKQKHPALFMSLEMAPEELINRLVGSSMNLNTHNLQIGNLTGEEWGRFTDGLADIKKWPFYIDSTSDLTIAALRSKALRAKHEYHIEALYVDYLQLMNEPDYRRNREQEISYISRGLKWLAVELQIPVIVCAQLNRDVEKRADHKPQLSDLRESGAIEQNANVVLFLYRDDKYNENSERPNQCDILIAKHRSGPTGVETLYFREQYTQFTSMQKSNIDMGWKPAPLNIPASKPMPVIPASKPTPAYLPHWDEPKEYEEDEGK